MQHIFLTTEPQVVEVVYFKKYRVTVCDDMWYCLDHEELLVLQICDASTGVRIDTHSRLYEHIEWLVRCMWNNTCNYIDHAAEEERRKQKFSNPSTTNWGFYFLE